MAVDSHYLRLSSACLLVSNTDGHHHIVQIGPNLPYLRFPGLQLQFRLQKVQSFPLQFVVHLHIPDIDPISLLGPVPQIPRQIIDISQGPLSLSPHPFHLLPRAL